MIHADSAAVRRAKSRIRAREDGKLGKTAAEQSELFQVAVKSV